jgi:glycosyltransferase involved in cell wall biosynthesis
MKCDIICFSHLRWNFVYQRPQHLLSRFAKNRRVFFIEEPMWDNGRQGFEKKEVEPNVTVITPYFSSSQNKEELLLLNKSIINDIIEENQLREWILWYYNPSAISYTNHIKPLLTIYDCMDELSSFKNPSPSLKENEGLLIKKADLMFMGGYSLYNAKRHLHQRSFPFPSSIDREHFFSARAKSSQDIYKDIPRPRLGFYGVIDERFNTKLLGELAEKNKEWNFIIIGPVVKISEKDLPTHANIHYAGIKSYKELPLYLSEWDIAIMPFALNEATRFISPTKTPEFLAAGKPVISTSIADVVEPYGNNELVSIADTADDFTRAAKYILNEVLACGDNYAKWLGKVDNFLHGMSWNKTFRDMERIIESALEEKMIKNNNKTGLYV